MEDSGVEDDLMEATRRALCEHGYAGLTMQDIADEAERSKATLHYHYDTKDDLLLGFLDHLLGEFRDEIDSIETEDPREEIAVMLTPGDKEDGEGFGTAVLEMKAQSPYNEGIRRRIAEHERYLRDRLADVVERGVDEGVFRDGVDPDEEAEVLLTLGNGVHTRSVTVGDDPDLRSTVEAYVERCLVAERPEDGR